MTAKLRQYDQMNILALETCTECCSAALFYDGRLYQHAEMTHRGHSDLILGMMDSLFADAGSSISQVDALAFGRGPGSFTGVRVGAGVAQGIAFARGIPVIPLSTLEALAQEVADTSKATHIAVAMDARMGEIYCASYQNKQGELQALDQERVCPPEQFTPPKGGAWTGVGSGWQAYESLLKPAFAGQVSQIVLDKYPTAATMIKLAQQQIKDGNLYSAEQAIPVYLRNNVAKKKGEQ